MDPSSHTVPAVQVESGVATAPAYPARSMESVIRGALPEIERVLVEAYEPECRRYTLDPKYARYNESIFFAAVCGDASRVVEHLVEQVGFSADVQMRVGIPKSVAVARNLMDRHPFWDDGHAVTFVQSAGPHERNLVDATAWQYLLNLSGAERNFYNDLLLDHRAFGFAQRLEELGQSERRVFAIDVSSEENRQISVREIAEWFTKTFRPWLEETVSEWIEPTGSDASNRLFFRYQKGSFPTQEQLEAALLDLWDPKHYSPPSAPRFEKHPKFLSIAEIRQDLDSPEVGSVTNRRLAAIFTRSHQ